MILAARPDLAELALEHPLDRVTPRTLTKPAQVARILARIRDVGYAVDAEETAAGWCCVAAPI